MKKGTLTLDERVQKIRGNNFEINRLLEEYKPFIASCTEKAAGRYVRYGEDDELSIAMMAFVEAVNAYNRDKGSFLCFAKNVIGRRIIDYYRKENRHNRVISINEYTDEDKQEISLDIKESLKKYEEDIISEYRRMEIIQLKEELMEWDISFDDLVKASPGQNRTRRMCGRIMRFIVSDPKLVSTIKEKRYLPVSLIEKSLGISRKKIERMRKYIIAALIVTTGDYRYIKEYITFWD
jgi:RNA polymerase sigma factor